jgi:FixJ family two-component response regulator
MKKAATGAPRISVSEMLVSVIDDDVSVRKALERLLASVRLRSVSYGSARDFLESDDLEVVDCLLLDLHLPGMSGMKLLERLSEVAPSLPVICMTGRGEPALEQRPATAETQRVLRKPFDQTELFEALSIAMGVAVCADSE